MLALLLDENISQQVAEQIRRRRPDINVVCIRKWNDGLFVAKPDEIILAQAASEKITLVTYDQKTIMPLLMHWDYISTNHGGVVFVDILTIATHDFGAIIRSLVTLWDASHEQSWENVIT